MLTIISGLVCTVSFIAYLIFKKDSVYYVPQWQLDDANKRDEYIRIAEEKVKQREGQAKITGWISAISLTVTIILLLT